MSVLIDGVKYDMNDHVVQNNFVKHDLLIGADFLRTVKLYSGK